MTSGPSGTGAPLWLRITLVVSLALNLLVAGIVLGAVIGRDRDGGVRDRLLSARDLGPAPFVVAIDPADRRALIDRLRAETAAYRPDRRTVRRELRALLATLRDDEFDAEAVRAVLADIRTRGTARQDLGADLLADYLGGLDPAARRAYADRLERALRRGRDGR